MLDINATTSGANSVVSGDLAFLCIKEHPRLPVVNGTARAIHSLSTLPSELDGSVKAAGLIDSAIVEYADNADAVAAGLATGTHYRTGDLLKIVH